MSTSTNTRGVFSPDPSCGLSATIAYTSSLSSSGNDRTGLNSRGRISSRVSSSSVLVRLAMRISRARWFSFLRRVFHYQNGPRSDLGSNPFNSGTWMLLELVALMVQITLTCLTLSVSKRERPVWPMRIWIVGYDIGCVLSLLLLYGRYKYMYASQGDGYNLSDVEQQRSTEDSRSLYLMNRCRTSLELFFAIWFVMGNVWVFDSRFGSFQRAPKLHVLCVFLLAWNAISYSLPFLLFLLLCCFVPLMSTVLGYNMNMASVEKGASDDQISRLPIRKYKGNTREPHNGKDADCESISRNGDQECCICLCKYKDKEEVRELPCSHMFHQKCVDQWLRIISCCPLCKKELDR
ncbi:hypothetical protein MLD38_035079 [Melastoma candidum]|uniref:Uncharacterized protein n=1 Tax=Melastoma candidum TaxID=119954 RepID=A0ACB9MDP1_9MYRT|nr:hypothetical protein MLD38_035079 [Melastoma candidum]